MSAVFVGEEQDLGAVDAGGGLEAGDGLGVGGGLEGGGGGAGEDVLELKKQEKGCQLGEDHFVWFV